MNILIVEDELLGAKRLMRMLLDVDPGISILGNTDSIGSTVKWIKENGCPDLLFMDIELGDGKSFDIFSQVEIKCPVIFTTAYNEYAIKALNFNAIDYLVKPIMAKQLQLALQKFKEMKCNVAPSGPTVS
jgi:two-component SAPR family response regulator